MCGTRERERISSANQINSYVLTTPVIKGNLSQLIDGYFYFLKNPGMEKNMKRIVVLILLLSSLITVAGMAGAADNVSVPKGYQKWEKSKARIITDKKSLFYGIHYIYVDKKALKAYQTGGTYPEGSRFVAVNYSIKDEGGKKVEGKKTMIVLMQKDKKQKASGGWLFAGFGPDGKLSGLDPVKDCYECHQKDAKATDLVISKYADFK